MMGMKYDEGQALEHLDTAGDDEAPDLSGLTYEAAQVAGDLDTDPAQVEQAAEAEAQEADAIHAGAEMTAGFITMMAENTALSIWPFLEYDQKTRERTTELLIPVIEKNGGELPPWLAAYKEELMLGGHVALVFLMTRAQIKKEDRRLEEEERKRKAANQDFEPAQGDQEAAA